ncbi:choice-of-anchor D domain-containing protein [Variovorax sp. J22R133]|uniref:choice-of-anchor D domain-containing protein n=1 Tax=Variovorax brevis TaxID=3053503 RepID=UPI0025791A9D|nr:choice-of-anchor D domain-containing protein [Variovorax sp. J22R133]MDM0110791.1 choice-of-anchor D domain-containing protein [Variovorax sp. J22R133]
MIRGTLLTNSLRAIVAVLLLGSTFSASAATEKAWAAWNNRTCWSCHSSTGRVDGRPDLSNSSYYASSSGFLNMKTEDDFIKALDKRPVPRPVPPVPPDPSNLYYEMILLAIATAPKDVDDRKELWKLLLDARDGRARPLGNNKDELIADELDFGNQVATAFSPRFVRIGNERGNAMEYTARIQTTAGFTITGNSCNGSISVGGLESKGTVAGGQVCDLTISFTSTPADGARTTQLNVVMTAGAGVDDIDPQLPLRPIILKGRATEVLKAELRIDAPPLFPKMPDTEVGKTSPPQELTLKSVAPTKLRFSLIDVESTSPVEFSHSTDCLMETDYEMNASCKVWVTFSPKPGGGGSAKLIIRHNGIDEKVEYVLNGIGLTSPPEPDVELSPMNGLDFGNQTVGGLFDTRSLRVTNSGNVTLKDISVSIEGAAFSIVGATTCAPLERQQSCEIRVLFSPPAVQQNYVGKLHVKSNAGIDSADLKGNGVGAAVPVLSWNGAPTQADFGIVSVGATSAVQSVMLFNNGPGGVTPLLINAVGTDSGMFEVVISDSRDEKACKIGRPLYEKDSCRIDLRFRPGSRGARGATLQIVSEGSPPPTMSLSGTGLSGPTPSLRLLPTDLSLDNTRVGSVSAPGEVTIQSTGAGVLTTQSIAVSGPFTLSNKTCPATPFTLPAGASCTVIVAFAPQSEGPASGTLTVTSDASPPSQSVALSAQGDPRARSGGGGCSMTSGRSPTDPTLWALVLLAFAALYARRRRRNAHRTSRADARQP